VDETAVLAASVFAVLESPLLVVVDELESE
jgi:hypothetical protein